MADLVSGRYGQNAAMAAVIGNLSNAVQSNIPARSNLEYLGLSTLTDGVTAATGVAVAVPVPVDAGTVISKVTIIVGATAASTPTHGAAGIYAGTGAAPAILASSADTLTGVIAASAAFAYTLSSPYLVKPADVPNGFLYASVFGAGTAVQTAAAVATPTAVGYQWFTSTSTPVGSSPLFLSATHGSSLTTAMPTTIASPSAKAVAPIVILT